LAAGWKKISDCPKKNLLTRLRGWSPPSTYVYSHCPTTVCNS